MGVVQAEPCLLVYPLCQTVFRFDSARYTLIYPGDSLYDQEYDRSGTMLWDVVNNRVPHEIYQAPHLEGFEASPFGRSEFYAARIELAIVIDGFYHSPRRLNDIYVRFLPVPFYALLDVRVNGVEVPAHRHHIPLMMVLSPLPNGFYSDTLSMNISWTGASALRVTAFADKDGDKAYDGEPCFSVYLEDPTIPVEETTWGYIKSLYRE